MKELPSNEFRRTFASLREPVTVTVHGHPIAIYRPLLSEEAKEDRRERTESALRLNDEVIPDNVIDNLQKISNRWPSQQFRPAPKPSRKRR